MNLTQPISKLVWRGASFVPPTDQVYGDAVEHRHYGKGHPTFFALKAALKLMNRSFHGSAIGYFEGRLNGYLWCVDDQKEPLLIWRFVDGADRADDLNILYIRHMAKPLQSSKYKYTVTKGLIHKLEPCEFKRAVIIHALDQQKRQFCTAM